MTVCFSTIEHHQTEASEVTQRRVETGATEFTADAWRTLLMKDDQRAWSRLTLRDSMSEAARGEHERYMGDALRRKITSFTQAEEHAPLPDRYLTLGQHGMSALLQVMMHPTSQRRVLLALSSPGELPSLPADLIGRVFALSPAESRVAAALCSGLTINEYASASGVTIGTARFQLKQVLAKTQVNRQADLVRQICSSVIAQALPASTVE
jgi:DNA-binding CsgD family transcriptional regulator